MRRALREYVVTGIATNLAFHQKLLSHASFCEGTYDTGFIEQHKSDLLGYADVPEEDEASLSAAIALAVHSASSEPRFEGSAAVAGAPTGSPWVQQHRARLMSR
jgi:acetyl-CoA carboxylase biotin carboxylase subunit